MVVSEHGRGRVPPVPPQVPHELVEALARAVAFRRVDWPVRTRVMHDPRTRAEYRSP